MIAVNRWALSDLSRIHYKARHAEHRRRALASGKSENKRNAASSAIKQQTAKIAAARGP
jgi:hypothetical protein